MPNKRKSPKIDLLLLAVEAAPDSCVVRERLADALAMAGEYDRALIEYRRCLELDSSSIVGHRGVARLKEVAEEWEAADSLNWLIENTCASFDEMSKFLELLRSKGVSIEDRLKQLCAAGPSRSVARRALLVFLSECQRYDETISIIAKADCDSHLCEVAIELLRSLNQNGKKDFALRLARIIVDKQPSDGPMLRAAGIAFFLAGQLEEALEALVNANKILLGRCHVTHHHLALVHDQLGDGAEARKYIKRALYLEPASAPTHMLRAQLMLRAGDFENGWSEYEWRRRLEQSSDPPWPLWHLESVSKCVLLLAEQGIGDTIQFIRYAQYVRKYAERVVLNCSQGLHELLSRTPGIDELIDFSVEPRKPTWDSCIRLMSIPNSLYEVIQGVPAPVPYVFPAPSLVDIWQKKLSGEDCFRVGIAWQGSAKNALDAFRSIPLKKFQRIANLKGVKLYSLQKGYGTEDLQECGFPVCVLDGFTEENGIFTDTCALASALDLVISPDSALVHLCGAANIPVWLLLPFTSDWRWLESGDKSAWYPSCRIFRQAKPGDWDGVLAEVAENLYSHARKQNRCHERKEK